MDAEYDLNGTTNAGLFNSDVEHSPTASAEPAAIAFEYC